MSFPCPVRFLSGALLVLALLLAPSADGLAQSTGTVTGTVTDASTGEPLPAVHVYLSRSTAGAVSGLDGTFRLDGIRPGTVYVATSLLGYASTRDTVVVRAGSATRLDLVLQAVYLPLPNVEVLGDAFETVRSEPGSVHRIDTRSLALAQPLGTEDMLRRVPGVHVSTDDGISNRINIGIRGSYPRRSDKILLLEDGVPIQPALYLAPSAYYNPPTERIDAIEVIKNTSNVRFGAGTTVGVVNYVTRRPSVEPRGAVRTTGGENGYFSTLASYSGMLPGRHTGGELQLLYKRGDGFRENTGFDVYNATGKLLYEPGPSTQISLKGNAHREDAQATYSALTPYMFEQDPAQNPFKDDFLATRRLAGDVHVRHVLGAGAVLTGTLYANQFQRYWWRQSNTVVDAQTIDPQAPENAMIRVGLEGNRARLRDFQVYGFAPRLLAYGSTGDLTHSLEIGARLHGETFVNREIDTDRTDARVEDFDAATTDDLSSPYGRKRTNEKLTAAAVALYAQNRIRFGRLSLTPGLRVERYRQRKTDRYDRSIRQVVREVSENTRTEVLGQLGFTIATPRAVFYGGVFQGFEPLTSSTAFAALVDDAGLEVDDDLASERSNNLEVGLRTPSASAFTLSAALFRNTIHNLIAAGRRATFQPVITNLGRVRYQGLELDAGAELGRLADLPFGLRLDAGLTLLDSEILRGLLDEEGTSGTVDVTGNEAPYAPGSLLNLAVTGRLRSGPELRLEWSRVGDQYADFNNTVEETPSGDNGMLAAYTFVNASLRYALPGPGLTLLASGRNLTNHIYRGSRMHRASSGIFPGGFRQINLGLEWTF